MFVLNDAAEAAVGRDDDELDPLLDRALSSSGCASGFGARGQRLQDRRRSCRAYGRAAKMRSCARRSLAARDHLHGPRDLLRVPDRADPPLEVVSLAMVS